MTTSLYLWGIFNFSCYSLNLESNNSHSNECSGLSPLHGGCSPATSHSCCQSPPVSAGPSTTETSASSCPAASSCCHWRYSLFHLSLPSPNSHPFLSCTLYYDEILKWVPKKTRARWDRAVVFHVWPDDCKVTGKQRKWTTSWTQLSCMLSNNQ